MAAPSGRTALWQVGGPKVPWRCIALPVRPGRLVIRRASTPRSAQDGGVETVMTPSDPVATAILGYLRAGLNGAAAMLVDCVLTASEQLDPVGGDPVGRGEDLDRALVVGYQLLSTGGVERGDDWPFDPLRRVPWLPDGHVIEAWSQLRRPDGNLALAREHLLAAVGQGIPLYTCGLRLLYDGLWLFDQRHHDKAVHEAFALVSGYASATAWEEPVTTFFGVDPTLPSPRPPTGLPPPAAVPEPAQLPAGLGRVVYARPAAMAAGRQAPAVHPARPFGRQTWELRADPHWQLSAQVDVRSYIRENAPVQAVHRGGHEVVVLATGEPLGRSWTTLPADEGDDVEQVLMAELGLRRAR
jgi:hypothetical protein